MVTVDKQGRKKNTELKKERKKETATTYSVTLPK